jgi:Type II secretion system (T2SS), protein M
MTGRDRMVLIGVVVLAVLGGAWMLVVSPEREKASKLGAQVAEAKSQLSTAEGQLANARAAQTQYAAAYASIVSLGKAVPPSQEVPSLIIQLARASNQKQVDFSSIVAGSGSSGAPTAAPTAVSGGFSQMPFTFVFDGTFFDLEHLFQQLNRFTLRTSSGGLQVSGRLLTIQSVKLSPVATSTAQGATHAREVLSGSITASAYVLPAGQSLTGGATPSSPTGTTPVSGTGTSPSTTTAPAIARVTP